MSVSHGHLKRRVSQKLLYGWYQGAPRMTKWDANVCLRVCQPMWRSSRLLADACQSSAKTILIEMFAICVHEHESRVLFPFEEHIV